MQLSILTVSHHLFVLYRDEFSEAQTAASTGASASGMNPYSSYYGATEYAARDYDEDRNWNSPQDSNRYY